METMLVELIKSAPSLAVLCFIVVTFLRYIKGRDEMIREIHAEHIAERQQTRASLDSNTIAMTRNTVALEDLSTSVEKTK